MSVPYFNQLPNFEYVNRNYDKKNISDYLVVKNLFKRAKIRDDIFQNLAFFDRYNIIGDERPDNVADKIYNDSSLDWVVLLSNNIINIQTDWPVPVNSLEKVLLDKYGSYDSLYDTHHYETIEVKDASDNIILPKGLTVPEKIRDYRKYVKNENGEEIINVNHEKYVPYFIEFYDYELDSEVLHTNITVEVTNYDYEIKIQEEKRHIYVLKSDYLNIIFDDIQNIMAYKKDSGQYVSRILKQGDNIRLYS